MQVIENNTQLENFPADRRKNLAYALAYARFSKWHVEPYLRHQNQTSGGIAGTADVNLTAIDKTGFLPLISLLDP